MSTPRLPVLIVGTGPSGLLLGHALKRASIPFQLFERDAAMDARSQGYRVRLTGPGVTALHDTLDERQLQTLKRASSIESTATSFTLLDALSTKSLPGGLPPRPAGDTKPLDIDIDRGVLRSVLARGLEKEIQFGHAVKNFTLAQDKKSVTANFTNGVSTTGSLLVGADGAWSRIRRQLVPASDPVDTEARMIYGKTPITSLLKQKLNAATAPGMTLVADYRHDIPVSLLLLPMIFDHARAADEAIDMPYDYVYWVLGSRKDRFDVSELGDKPTSEACAAFARRAVKHWHPSFHALFDLQDVSKTTLLRIATAVPGMRRWETGRVTLIGDAAHCLSPTTGVGATTALRDAAFLGRVLAEDGISTEAVKRYEEPMREWAEDAVGRTMFFGKKIFGMRDFEDLKPFDRTMQM